MREVAIDNIYLETARPVRQHRNSSKPGTVSGLDLVHPALSLFLSKINPIGTLLPRTLLLLARQPRIGKGCLRKI
jgi:hypothetical protein